MKQQLLNKLTSRKFWSLVAALVTTILISFNVGENDIAKVTAIIGAFASVISYMFAEAYVDGKRTQSTEE